MIDLRPKTPEFRIRSALVAAALVMGGCATSAITPGLEDGVGEPATWQRASGPAAAVVDDWLAVFDDPLLNEYVARSVAANYRLQQEAARVRQARETVVVVRADRLPSLTLALDATRRRTAFANQVISNYIESATVRWQADVWGQLRDAQRAALLTLAASEARLTDLARVTAADTASAYYAYATARDLLEVAERRLANARESLDIVESGYRAGINDALDLYLARTTAEAETANVAQQRQSVAEAASALQLLTAAYPSGEVALTTELPVLSDAIATGVPSDLLTRRADLESAWLDLLAADADLAVAHKQRFPSLTLTGNASDDGNDFGGAFDGDSIAWSLIGSITQPVFQGGRLRALERRAAARVEELEQVYLDRVNSAFAEVENAISRDRTLAERYQALVSAQASAESALTLALQQYQRGIVNYTTVLESQRRAFDARQAVVQLRGDLLQNRIALYLALGGEFSAA
jgi:NodT family efflux transporter outer membrane factor (OMF) lipoprotein